MEYAGRASITWMLAPQERTPAPLTFSTSRTHHEQTARADAAMGRYARGDDEAFDELYRSLKPRLYRLCLYLAGRNDAEELMQDVFMKMHRARSSFVETGSVVAWAFAIARTTHLDRLRHRKRRPEISVEHSQLERHTTRDSSCPETAYAFRTVERTCERELSQLSETLRSAYLLVRVHGLSCADAGAALGVSIHAVKQRVHRASETLKAALGHSSQLPALQDRGANAA